MNGHGKHRRTRALTMLPVAMLSATWVSGLSSLAGDTSASPRRTVPAAKTARVDAPYAVNVPVAPIAGPASTLGRTSSRALAIQGAADTVSTASAWSIPDHALAAYERAAQVIDAADSSCHLGWQLLAALGRVESDHGRSGGNVLSSDGVSTPGVFGPRLDGSGGTQVLPDTDGGQLDGDPSFDRAVGPMQFIPSTWSAVRVDADADGVRNPQDIDDAALAAAVYLCSGSADLGTADGERSAVFRYNHSAQYVRVVLALASAYADGGYAAVPAGTMAGAVLAPAVKSDHAKPLSANNHAPAGHPAASPASQTQATPRQTTPAPSPRETAAAAPQGLTTIVRDVATGQAPPTVAVGQVLTAAEATTLCLRQGLSALDLTGLAACVAQLVGSGGR